MNLGHQHDWDVTTAEARKIQTRLVAEVRLEPLDCAAVRYVAATDVSFSRGESLLHAAAVCYDLKHMAVVEEVSNSLQASFPYVPGYLSFREVPAAVAVIEALEHPFEAVLCDGQGLAHPRRFGLACHLGVLLDVPAVGVAKSKLVGDYREPGREKGSSQPLMDGDEQIGVVLRSRTDVKPLFVSPGHRCDFPGATELTLASLGPYRLPEPSRRAHSQANARRREANEKN